MTGRCGGSPLGGGDGANPHLLRGEQTPAYSAESRPSLLSGEQAQPAGDHLSCLLLMEGVLAFGAVSPELLSCRTLRCNPTRARQGADR